MNKTIETKYAKYDVETDEWCSHNRVTFGVGIDSFNNYNKVRRQIDHWIEQEKITAGLMKGIFSKEK